MKNVKLSIMFLSLIGICMGCDSDDNNSNPNALGCLPVSLQTGIIAYYPFNGGSLNDFSGNGNHLANTTTAFSSEDRDGNTNCAFEFVAANNDFLTIVNPTFIDDFDSNPFSISLWFKAEGTRAGGLYEQIIGRDTGLHCPDTYGQWSFSLSDCRNVVFGINDYSIWGDGWPIPYGDTDCINDPSKNQWHHVVMTSNGPNNINLYINGLPTSDTPTTGCTNPLGTSNIGDLFIGKEYTGLVDDIVIYDRILTQTEVTQLFNLDPCCE